MPAELHSHNFKGVTTYINGHLHLFSGVSGASPNVPGHTHIIAGQTTVNARPSHPYSLTTEGPTYVDTENYKHYHYYKGNTFFILNHSHPMSETTFVFGE